MIRRLAHVLILMLTLVVGAAAMAVIVSQTAWFKDWLRGYIERQAGQYLNGHFSIERLGGNLFFGVELENIGVSMDGSEVVAVKDVGLDYNLFQLLASGLSVDDIRLNQPVVYLRRDGDAWSISRLIKRDRAEADRSGPDRAITIDQIGVTDGTIVIEGPVGTSGVSVPNRFDHVDARLAFRYEPVRYSIDIANVTFRGSDPEIALNALSGGISVHDDSLFLDDVVVRTAESTLTVDGAVEDYLAAPVFKVDVRAEPLSLPEWAALIPSLEGIDLRPAFDLKTSGPADRLSVDLNVRSDAGAARATAVADLRAPERSVDGTVAVQHLDLAPLLRNEQYRSDITGEMKLAADVDRGVIDIDGGAEAYGASATAAGRVIVPGPDSPGGPDEKRIAFDLRGRAAGLDLRRLPVEGLRAATDISAAYHAAGNIPSGSGSNDVRVDARFDPSTIAGARIGAGSTAEISFEGDQIRYAVDADVANLDLQRIGREFRIPALAADRYASALNGRVSARGRGTDPRRLTLDAHGTLTDSSFVGGRVPRLDFDASMGGDAAHVKAHGAFLDLDPAVVTGRESVAGNVDGTMDVDATIAGLSRGVTPDSVRASGTVNLDASTIGDVEITRATMDADYANATGVIRTLDIAGRDMNVSATGKLALNDTGQSSLQVHADSSNLDAIGKMFEQPIGGIGRVDATLTGNRRELTLAGTFTGGGVKYGGATALNATSRFTAVIPDLTPAGARVSAVTEGTFVTIAGQEINRVHATTDYADRRITFDATARQPQRALSAAGDAILHPDHQEVHLNRLSIESQGVAWSTAPASRPVVQYGGDAITVHDVRLVNGDQQIAADGTFGNPGAALDVTLTNIDLATVDALMLQPPRFTGRLTATATVSGTKESPAVDADFNVVQGGFRQFHYDSFGGSITYGGPGIRLDARMTQGPSAWITAKGYAPLSLFKPRPEPAALPPHDAAVPPAERVDLQIDSSPIDLGIVQGFTTAVTDVTGTVEAHVHVTGSGADPHPVGSVAFDEGAFTVEETGVSYAHLRGDVQLDGDRLHIDTISVLDNHDSALSFTGDVAVHQRRAGDVQMYVTARDFKVIDNELGNVRLNSDIEITGELRAPKIAGDISVSTGEINVDELLALAGDSAYATEPTEYLEPAAAAAGAPPSNRSLLDAADVNVRLTVPDDLVVKASSLEIQDSPVSAGALSITLGGDVRVTLAPGGRPQLLGAVNTVRGYYDFQGRRFTILRDGTIRFIGGNELDPELDVRAERAIRGVTARVNVRGSLRQPEIALSSTPPLEEADILSLIIFNQPVNELGTGQQISLAQRAQSLAAGAAAGALQQSIGSALNIDEFAISLSPDSGESAQVTVGEQVGQNLYLRVQQGVGAQSQTNLIIEYELTDWLRLRTNVLQGAASQRQLFERMQGSGVDLLFFFSY